VAAVEGPQGTIGYTYDNADRRTTMTGVPRSGAASIAGSTSKAA
jgi:hypothetical protein